MRHYLKAMNRIDAKSSGGIQKPTWEYAFHFYGAAESEKTTEGFRGVVPSAKTTVTFSTWLRDDLKREMKIVEDDEEYIIVDLTRSFKTMSIICERVD